MKKLYMEPDIELVNVGLMKDVLSLSTQEPEDETNIPGGGSGFEGGGEEELPDLDDLGDL